MAQSTARAQIQKPHTARRAGFTLVEMLVIAPIVILTIGAFIALIVNLTGEVLSSRGSNVLAYDVQDTLNRIEEDVKMSTTFLAKNSIAFTPTAPANPQGYGANGSYADFQSSGHSSGPMLILNGLVTNGDPMSLTSSNVYLADKPNPCGSPADYAQYSKNRPLSMNIIYFTDSSGTLWRRTVMEANYDTVPKCGTVTMWQRPSCGLGYSSSFCKTNDIKLAEGVGATGLTLEYFTSADAATPLADATSTDDATRATALKSATTLRVSLTANKTIAGRDISRTGTIRVTRLDTNATGIANYVPPTAAPASPVVTGAVSDGHNVTFTWPQVPTATAYELRYSINGGALQVGNLNLTNGSRAFTVTAGNHTDTVTAQVIAKNERGNSAAGTTATIIPLWAPLILQNGWADYGAPYAPPSYTKTRSGVIILRGLLRGGSGVIANVPADYRPSSVPNAFATSANQAFARVDVSQTGDISMPVGSNPWLSLDGITYPASTLTNTSITGFVNSWSIYSPGSWQSPNYATDGSGRVHLRGLISGGTTTDGTVLVTLPSAARPAAQYTQWVQANSNTTGAVGYNPTGTALVTKGGGNSYLTMNALYYPLSPARATGTTCTTQWCALPMDNSWVHYGSPYTTPQYTKGTDGLVMVKGLIRSGTAARMATLPSGYCPKNRLVLTVYSAGAWGRVDVLPSTGGTCYIEGNSYSATSVSLDTVRFMAE